jgi:hypothetical protein
MYKAIINRIVELIRSPRAAWIHIEEENKSVREIQNRFFYPLVLVVTIGTIVGAFWGAKGFPLDQMLKKTVIVLTSTFAGYFISVIVLNEIVVSRLFNMERQYAACVRIIAYSSSIMLCVDTIIAIIPDLFILRVLYFYTAYIIWEGAGIIFKGLEESRKGVLTAISLVLLYVSPYLIKILMYMMMK